MGAERSTVERLGLAVAAALIAVLLVALAIACGVVGELPTPETRGPALVMDMPEPPGMSCEVYVSSDVPKSIPDNSGTGITSTLTVSDTDYVGAIQVTIQDIQHTYVDDLQVYLISPTSTQVILLDRVDSGGDDFDHTVLYMGAARSIDDANTGDAPFIDDWEPSGNLNDFVNENANGTWTLWARDVSAGDTGSIEEWEIKICTDSDPIPATEVPSDTPTPTFTPTPTSTVTPTPAGPCETVIPEADCWSANGGSYAGKSCVTYKNLQLGEYGSPCGDNYGDAEAFLRFDVSDYVTWTIGSATLYLNYAAAMNNDIGCTTDDIQAQAVYSDTWAEGILLWGSRPAMEDLLDDGVDSVGWMSGGDWETWDVSDWIISEATGDGKASIGMRYDPNAPTADEYFFLYNRESAVNKPYVKICAGEASPTPTYTPSPTPTDTPTLTPVVPGATNTPTPGAWVSEVLARPVPTGTPCPDWNLRSGCGLNDSFVEVAVPTAASLADYRIAVHEGISDTLVCQYTYRTDNFTWPLKIIWLDQMNDETDEDVCETFPVTGTVYLYDTGDVEIDAREFFTETIPGNSWAALVYTDPGGTWGDVTPSPGRD